MRRPKAPYEIKCPPIYSVIDGVGKRNACCDTPSSYDITWKTISRARNDPRCQTHTARTFITLTFGFGPQFISACSRYNGGYFALPKWYYRTPVPWINSRDWPGDERRPMKLPPSTLNAVFRKSNRSAPLSFTRIWSVLHRAIVMSIYHTDFAYPGRRLEMHMLRKKPSLSRAARKSAYANSYRVSRGTLSFPARTAMWEGSGGQRHRGASPMRFH